MNTFRRPAVAALAAVSLGLGLTGCGQSGSSTPAANSLAPTVSTASAAPSSTTPAPATQQVTAAAQPSSGTASGQPGGSATSGAPASSPSDALTHLNAGPYRIGRTGSQLVEEHLAVPSRSCEKSWDATTKGFQLAFDGDSRLDGVLVTVPGFRTLADVEVGTPFATLAKAYGKDYQERRIHVSEGQQLTVGRVGDGRRAILFGAVDEDGEWTDVRPGATVGWISVQADGDTMPYGC